MPRIFKLFVLATFLFTQANAAWVRKGTTVVYINGIGTLENSSDPKGSSANTQRQLIEVTLQNYLRSVAYAGPLPTVQLGYNKTEGKINDLVESAQQATGFADLTTPMLDIYKLTDPNASPFALIGAGSIIANYTEELVKFSPVLPVIKSPDYVLIRNNVKDLLRQGQQVIMVTHSQGLYFANFIYEEILADVAFQQEIGVTLPNPNVLAIVAIAAPAPRTADGRNMYVTHCNDIIQLVTGHLKANVTNFGCTISDVLSGPLSFDQAAQRVIELRDVIQSTVEFITKGDISWNELFGIFTAAADYPRAVLYVSHLKSAIQQHYLDFDYLPKDGHSTDASKKILGYLEDSLPDPGCNGDTNCYLKDGFTSPDIKGNWAVTNGAGLFSSIKQTAGMLELDSRGFIITDELTLRPRRVFAGSFTGSLSFNHIGGCQSSMRLKKVVDDSLALALTINNCAGQDSLSLYPLPASPVFLPAASGFKGWHQITFAKTDAQVVTMSVDGNGIWAQNTSDVNDGYYIEIDSQGNNTLQIRDLSVVRGVVNVPPPPTYTAAPPTQSVSVVAGQSVFADVTFSGKNNPAVNGSLVVYCQSTCPAGFSYNFTSAVSLPANGSSTWRFTVFANSAVPGTYNYTPTLTIGSTTVTAKIAVTVTAPTASTPTITVAPPSQAVSVVAGQSVNADTTWIGKNNPAGTLSLPLWCMQSTCPAGFSYNFPVTATLAANGNANARITFTTISTTPLGTFNYEYRGALGNLSAVAKIAVTVTAPVSTADFTAVAVSSSITVQQSSSGALQATATPSGGLTGPVTMTVAGAPAGVTITNASGSITGPSAITLTSPVSVLSAAVAGSYPLTATITGGGKTKTLSFTLVVVKATATTGTVVVVLNGYNGTASCALNGVSFTAPTTLVNQAVGSKTAACTAPTGYTITSITPSQNLTGGATVTFTVTLVPIPGQTLTALCTSNPAVITAGQSTVFTGSFTGGTLPVTGIWSGVVSGTATTATFNTTTSTPPASYAAFYTVTDSGSPKQTKTASCGVSVNAPPPPTVTFRLDSIQISPNIVGVVRITATGVGITATTSMELAGPFCNPCLPNAKISQTATTLVMDAQINNPGTFTVKLLNGSLSTAGKDFVVNPAPPPTTGTVTVVLNGYNGAASCTLNGVSFTAPTTLANQALGNKVVACTAPPGFTLGTITPSSTQNLTGGVTVTFTVTFVAIPATGTIIIKVLGYSSSFNCNLKGINITAPNTLTNQAAGTYPLSCTPPAGFTLGPITPSSSQNLPAGGTVNFVVTLVPIPAPPLSCSCSLSPNPINLGTGTTLFGNCTGGKGGYLLSLNGGSFQAGNSTSVLPSNGGTFSYSVTGKDSSGATASNSCPLTVNGIPPNSIGFFPDSQPIHGVFFSGNITGNAFALPSAVWFYGPGCPNGCPQSSGGNPPGVTVLSPSNIRVQQAKLAAGTWVVEVRTNYGSARSSNFTVR